MVEIPHEAQKHLDKINPMTLVKELERKYPNSKIEHKRYTENGINADCIYIDGDLYLNAWCFKDLVRKVFLNW